ncbi:MAG: pyruvate, water dikinase regulatory protein, partial [Alphaproteobacteria bacterium]
MAGCRRLKVPCISVLDPIIAALGTFLGEQPSHQPGRQHEMNAEYFMRIEAMDWALAHDDGQMTADLRQTDVILVGVSRTSKTPTCLYLANRGVKAANVPYIPGVPLPDGLDQSHRPVDERIMGPLVVGLTKDPRRLVEIRRARLLSLRQEDETSYVDLAQVRAEIAEARRLFSANDWPVLNVSRRSIEETAAAIVLLLKKHREAVHSPAQSGEPPSPVGESTEIS